MMRSGGSSPGPGCGAAVSASAPRNTIQHRREVRITRPGDFIPRAFAGLLISLTGILIYLHLTQERAGCARKGDAVYAFALDTNYRTDHRSGSKAVDAW